MANNQHTPGKWTFFPKYEGENAVAIQANGIVIAEVLGSMTEARSPEEAKANARLIASAPTMLEALKGIVDELVNNDIIVAAMLKGKDKEPEMYAHIIQAQQKSEAAIQSAEGSNT